MGNTFLWNRELSSAECTIPSLHQFGIGEIFFSPAYV